MTDSWNNSADFSDDAIRRFLLGRLRAAEQSTLEERLFTDDILEARVRLAEFDLADDYALARLSAAERRAFEERFLLTADRKQTLLVSEALRRRFAFASKPELQIARKLKSLLDIRQPAWRYAFGALVVILLIATLWLATKEPQIVRRFFPKGAAPKPSATATPQAANHPSNTSSTPRHAEESPTMPAHELPVLSIVLEPNDMIDKAPTVKLPQHDGGVRLQLMLKKNDSRLYRAELLTVSGESLFSPESLTSPDGATISFDIPANVLKTGDYQVRLKSVNGASKEVVKSYHFRVQ